MLPRLIAIAAAVVVAAGCGTRAVPLAAAGAPLTWTSELDGLALQHPDRWRVAGQPMTPYDTDTFEVVALSTFDPPAGDGRCDPVPLTALEAMGGDDALLVLREAVPGWEEAEDRALAAVREVADRPGCPPPSLDVHAWERDVVDEATGRRFHAYVAAGGDAPSALVDEAWAILDSLQVEAVPGPDDDVPVGRAVRHFLMTHCGVRAAHFDGRDWVGDPPLDDGQGNPPASWAGGRGTMVLEAEDRAVFRNLAGQEAAFRPRTPADPPEPPCD